MAGGCPLREAGSTTIVGLKMTTKNMTIEILALALIGIVAGTYFLPVCPYRPYQLLRSDDGWQPVDEWLTPGHCDRLVQKLREDGEWCLRLGSTKVLITGRLKMDTELTGNFSQKAGPD
jgi:hypothetical protein